MLQAGTFLLLLAAPQQSLDESDLRCGSYCLYVSLKALDLPVGEFSELESKLGQPTPAGYSLGDLAEAARSYRAHTLGVQTTVENLRRRPGRFACIAHLDGKHFVTVAKVDDKLAYVIDPPRSYELPLDTLRQRWNGTALLISDAPLVREEDLPRPFPWKTISALTIVLVGTMMLYWLLRLRLSKRQATVA